MIPSRTSVKNLIFDLGGVILDLSVDDTLNAFTLLSGLDKQQVIHLFKTSSGFNEYEKGFLSDSEFRSFIRELYKLKVEDHQIDACWNAMLLSIPLEKLKLLLDLKSKYSIYLLSNTNGIHLDFINERIMPFLNGDKTLDSYFHKAYYSHQMKKRKPDAEIYLQVLTENNLRAHETLFLDDNIHNIEGAKSVGIQTVFVDRPELMLEYFHE